MLSYTFINSHSQVSDPGPKGPLVSLLYMYIDFLSECGCLAENEDLLGL